MSGGAPIPEVTNYDDRRPHDKNADHVCSERIQRFV